MARASSSLRSRATTAATASRMGTESTMRPSVLLTKRLPSAALAPLEAAFDVELDASNADLTHADLIARVPGKQALVSLFNNQIDRAVIDAGADLKIIATVAVGYNNIDVAAAKARGIVVTNTPDVLTDATA